METDAVENEDGGLSKNEEARAYLEQHRILQLFDNMTAQLIYHRPG